MKVKFPGIVKNFITLIQFVQMLFGVAVIATICIKTDWIKEDPFSVRFVGFMYSSYVYLFGELFFGKVGVKNVKSSKKKKV